MKIAIFGQYYQNNTAEIVTKVVQFLEAKSISIAFENSFLKILQEKNIITNEYPSYSNYTELDSDFEALISIGGDGTILKAATFIRDKNIPIIGINAGRLGFLATVQFENIETLLQKVLIKDYIISKRSLLSVKTNPEYQNFKDLDFALNEVTVARKDTTSMITIETSLNGEYLTSYWADGLIVSTPTGSTGYSLSCGGPVLTPEVASFVVTPMAPHNLNARPLVITDDTEIELKISGREEQFLISLDSRIAAVSKETTVYIRKAPFTISIIEFKEETFLNTIRKKLLWGADKRN
ncbi:NAD kinase [Flavobacterium celericrescens]|jgi:NAD+ kinase|uniref:NAD kinase n=1 Tax=Flavobacterium celericrescens TaxID=2709780 RepID=A0ABX0IDT4_9FLAO|nr:NAD kinase [Flavobacterium celericrescens]NHM04340.1 NAD kinase [Flavobacterium celericrescens]